MSIQEIEDLEKLLQSYKKSLAFAKEMKNKTRQSKYEKSIREGEQKIKEIEEKYPYETKARLQKIDNELTAKIEHLKEENDFLIAEFDEPFKTIDRLLNPEKYKPKEPEPEPIVEPIVEPEIILKPEDDNLVNTSELLYSTVEPEPLIEAEQDPIPIPIPIPEPEGKIPCPDCGKLVKGKIGLRAHQSRWCIKINEEVEVFEQ